MPDKKLTDNEIVNELECAKQWFTEHGRNTNTAIVGICERAVDLINRQEKENNRLDNENDELKADIGFLDRENEKLQAENEKSNAELKNLTTVIKNLTSENRNLTSYLVSANAENERLKIRLRKVEHQLDDAMKMYNTIKAEAYKEVFAIINECYNEHIFGNNDLESEEKDAVINFSDDITYRIDNLLKELVGDK